MSTAAPAGAGCAICRNLGPDAPCFAHRPAPQPPVTLEANVIHFVETARRSKAPIVGIPIAGAEPFILRRDLLAGSLKGLVVTEAAIQLSLPGGRVTNLGVGVSGSYADADAPAPPRYLQVLAEGNGVKAWRRFHPLTRAAALAQLREWAEHERAKGKPRDRVRLSAREKHLARLRKRLAKLMQARPANPCLPPRWATDSYFAESYAHWQAEKPKRRLLAPLLMAWRKGEISKADLLARAEALGMRCWSPPLLDMGQPDAPWHAAMYLFNGCGKPPRLQASNDDAERWGAARLNRFCQNYQRGERDELRAEIAAVLALSEE